MLTVNQKKSFDVIVAEQHSAITVGSGDLSVLGTPAMIALMEQASVQLVTPLLEEGTSTVGIHLSVEHLKATPMGAKITVSAELTAIDGRKLTFALKAVNAENETIGEGTLDRFIIDKERFMAKLS
ncbi:MULTISPECIES: thioesterase family protein [Porphyromonas]|uniref:Thioesterase superfamily n=1 Tax=Porphyromonas circumdentaria TaxID=29524 RepID=A0A1T4N7Q2_9PORP|nr:MULTISPECIES: thioesterase family protein [Porphyromonas]MBB6276060.1 putative thioesterase [Porphyromonas circumdentaria]MDO4722449.1 thioesterase family protein [Porphyromonas circumdentaria]SJZ75077.1 Thioesterase superfamily [Porphyromonas circumdentaria]